MREDPIPQRNAFDGRHAAIGRDWHPRRHADSAGDAGLLTDRGLRGLRIDPDDFRAGPLRRAERDAFEMAALGLTPILKDDGDAHCEFDGP